MPESTPKWIWKRGIKQEKNLWLEFTTGLFCPNDCSTVNIEITADSRYILNVDGKFIGRGPPRYWPQKMQYDMYSLSVPEDKKMNIRVLVHYFGCGTYQYIPGIGGLWCKLIFVSREQESAKTLYTSGTNSTWLVRKIKAYNWNTERICRHQGFVEEFDSTVKDDTYENAVEIDEPDALSFGKPVKRDIPLLNHYPVSCTRRALPWHIIPPTWWSISEKTNCLPEDAVIFLNIEFIIYQRTPITIFLYYGTLPLDITLNGENIFPGKEIILDGGEYIIHSRVINRGDYRIKTAINVPKEAYTKKQFLPRLNLSCGSGKPPVIQTSKFPAADFPPDSWLISTASRKDEQITESHVRSQNPEASSTESLSRFRMVLDFREEVSGYLSFELEASKECIIDFYLFEMLLQNGEPEHTDGLHNILRYRAKPGRQSYESVTPRAGRYLMVTVLDKVEIDFLRLNIINSLYPGISKGTFLSNNTILNSIWELCRKTTILCMEDTFIDCPTYERTYWVGDAGIQGLCAYSIFGDYSLQRHCLILASHTLERSPYPEGRVPTHNASRIPSWALIWVTSIWEYFIYSGDKELLYQLYPDVKKTIEAFNKMIRKNLLWTEGWNFIDWGDVDSPPGSAVTAVNAFFINAIEAAERIASIIKESDNSINYKSISKRIRAEVNRLLWDPKRTVYLDCIRANGVFSSNASEQTQILAFLAGICRDKRKIILKKRISSFPSNTLDARIGTPYFMHYLFTALKKMRKIDRVHALVQEYWGPMIQADSPGCFEVFPGYQQDRMTRSYCHGWSASPLHHMRVTLLGVEPLEPGFTKICVVPGIELEKKCTGAVPTPRGTIYIEWEILEALAVIRITVPFSIKGYIKLPLRYEWTYSNCLEKKHDSDNVFIYFNSGDTFTFTGNSY